jgi:YVTN family beta-propeller protein
MGPSGKFALVNRAQGKLTHTVDLGGDLGAIRFRKDARWAMAADRKDRGLVFFDMSASRVGVRVPLHLRPDQFCFKPDGGQLFVTGDGLDAVVTVYPYQTEVGSTMLAGRAPGMMAASLFPSYLFVANPISNTVTILNVATQKVMGAVQVGREPAFLAITPNQEYALALNRQSGDMSVLHIPSLSARRTKAASLFTQVPVGSEPVAAVVRAV